MATIKLPVLNQRAAPVAPAPVVPIGKAVPVVSTIISAATIASVLDQLFAFLVVPALVRLGFHPSWQE